MVIQKCYINTFNPIINLVLVVILINNFRGKCVGDNILPYSNPKKKVSQPRNCIFSMQKSANRSKYNHGGL